MPVNAATLQSALQGILPGASVRSVQLPECHGLTLLLIDPDYVVEKLPPDIACRVMDNPLYWLFCWASGLVMARRIMQEPWRVKDKIILDVGSGSGVVAIAAAMAGARQVIASDIDELSRQAIRWNAQANGVELQVIGDYREWVGAVDVITIADVLYDRANIPLLDDLVERSAMVWLADSRIRDFNHPVFQWEGSWPGETFPDLGGFDEFSTVNMYLAQRSGE